MPNTTDIPLEKRGRPPHPTKERIRSYLDRIAQHGSAALAARQSKLSWPLLEAARRARPDLESLELEARAVWRARTLQRLLERALEGTGDALSASVWRSLYVEAERAERELRAGNRRAS